MPEGTPSALLLQIADVIEVNVHPLVVILLFPAFRTLMKDLRRQLLDVQVWPYWFPGLSSMRKGYGTGIPTLLRPLRAMPGLGCLLQSNYYPASEVTLFNTYLPVRPAPFTRWPLLACLFPRLNFSSSPY